jgi:uncharacterized protein (DUF433 family)
VSTPRGNLRPDSMGRERPPSKWVRGRPPGVAEGVAHAPSSLSAIIRAASAAAKNAAAFSTTARAHPLVCQRVAISVSSTRWHRQPRRSARPVQRLKGDNSDPRRCPPFCPPCPLLEGCDKLTLTLTATKGASEMKETEPVIHSDPEIMGGTPVFVGTRVPLATLLDYLEAGQPLSEFLEDFPTVTREQAVAALEQAKEALLTRARPA